MRGARALSRTREETKTKLSQVDFLRLRDDVNGVRYAVALCALAIEGTISGGHGNRPALTGLQKMLYDQADALVEIEATVAKVRIT